MYLGKIVERASAAALYESPRQPYTTSPLSAVPVQELTALRQRLVLQGDVPSRAPPRRCAPRAGASEPETTRRFSSTSCSTTEGCCSTPGEIRKAGASAS